MTPPARQLRGTLLVLATLGSSVAVAAPVRSRTSEITVGLSTSKLMTVQGHIKTIAVSDPNLVTAKLVSSNAVQLSGMKNGETILLIWLADGQRLSFLIKVRAHDPVALAHEVKARFGEMKGITLRIVGDKVYVEGTPITCHAAERLRNVLALYPEVRNLTIPADGPLIVPRVPVGVGSERALPLPGKIHSLRVTDPRIFAARTLPDGNTILVRGLKRGQAGLDVQLEGRRTSDYRVVVDKPNPGKLVREVQAQLGDIKGISFRVVGDDVYIDGTPSTPEDEACVTQALAGRVDVHRGAVK